jgi:putative RecB family exonuclease
MKFYALVLWRLRGAVPRRLQLVYLGSGDVVTYDPTEQDLRATERKLLALWEAIRLATRSGDWRPRQTKLCGWCDHQAHCPEFGGTPPPYPLEIIPAEAAPGDQGRMERA